MKISYNWLQTYFKEKLPAPEKVAELLTFHTCEVESVVERDSDFIFDIKVLPDRAHYALSHKGIALEVSAISKLPRVLPIIKKHTGEHIPLELSIKDKLCRRYMGRVIENVVAGDSPSWLKEKLEAIGSRSINSIVDVANYVMFDVGQPMHAFDKAKVKGEIVVRKAKEGEKITTLDGKEVVLDSSMLIIADTEGPLAIAGVKGGKRAEVTQETKSIILESANFDPTSVRRTSTKIGIRNDSSKRFENNLSPVVAEEGMASLTALIAELSPQAKIGDVVDYYPEKQHAHTLTIKPASVSRALGVDVPENEMVAILQRLEVEVKQNGEELELTVPSYRRDIVLFEDVVEEVGRIYGYEKIKPILPPQPKSEPSVDKGFYYAEKIKDVLMEKGFSEVYLYTFTAKGAVEVAYPLASDKKALRSNLEEGIVKALELNIHNSDVVGLDQIKIFEIGKIFTVEGETTSFAIGAQQIKKVKGLKAENILDDALDALERVFGVSLERNIKMTPKGAVIEFDFDKLIQNMPDPENYHGINFTKTSDTKYHPFSVYPFIVRDIAVFVPSDVTPEELQQIIKREGGELLIKTRLFDVFKKKDADGIEKTSYAFRMVFQSYERTLVEEEVNTVMERITKIMNSNPSWQVR